MPAPTTEWIEAAPRPPLAPLVDRAVGYHLRGYAPGVHAGLPSRSMTLIVSFDDPLEVVTTAEPDGPTEQHWVMLAGLHDRPSWVPHTGEQHGIQISLSPFAARAVFGVSAAELAGRSVSVDQIDATLADRLLQRLAADDDWGRRMRVVGDELQRHLTEVAPPPPEVEHAWELLVRSGGCVSVGQLAAEVGWSRRHLSQRFREAFGLSPKTTARVLRFERSRDLVVASRGANLASIAAGCGYADQAHMAREWRDLAGRAPSAWLASEHLPIVQDDDVVDGRRSSA